MATLAKWIFPGRSKEFPWEQKQKRLRKEYGLTQEELALKSGVGLNFVRNLEQGKPSLRMDKVNQLLDLFNYTLSATPKY